METPISLTTAPQYPALVMTGLAPKLAKQALAHGSPAACTILGYQKVAPKSIALLSFLENLVRPIRRPWGTCWMASVDGELSSFLPSSPKTLGGVAGDWGIPADSHGPQAGIGLADLQSRNLALLWISCPATENSQAAESRQPSLNGSC